MEYNEKKLEWVASWKVPKKGPSITETTALGGMSFLGEESMQVHC